MAGSLRRNANELNIAEGASEQEILSFILRAADPKTDADAAAAALLKRFDRLAEVLDAPRELLEETPGISTRTAALLASYPDVFRAYTESKNQTRLRIVDTQCAFQAVRSKFYGRRSEIMVLLILDSKGYLKYMDIVSEGSSYSVPIYIREIIRLCILYQAEVVFVAHNHPSGNCAPSRQDILSTKELELALSSIDVMLFDHFIFSDDDFLSMRACGVLQKLRQTPETAQVPVIMMTAKSSEYDKVTGLDAGADDYIPKPFGMMELVSRVKAVLRRTEPLAQEEYRLGSLYVCPARHLVMAGDQEVKLALKEFELLCLLLRNAGLVLTRDALLNQIWGYSFDGESRTVDVHIRNLRKKLGDAGNCIETVKGIGYKIGGAVHG